MSSQTNRKFTGFAGLWALLKLNLRRDRIYLPAWVVAITGLYAAVIASVEEIIGSDAERMQFIAIAAVNPVLRFFAGPVTGETNANVVVDLRWLIMLIFVAVMSALIVTRHTRANEDTGRSELVGSLAVGRHAELAAALLSALIANFALAITTAGLFSLAGFELPGSIAVGLGSFGLGMVFAGIAAISAQVFPATRQANLAAFAVIMLSFITRGLGDMLTTIEEGSYEFSFHFLSWLSPFGWARMVLPYADEEWWVLLLFASAGILLAVIAFLINAKRDFGAGLVATPTGKPEANRLLLHPFGLAWNLLLPALKGWVFIVVVFSVAIGVMVNEAGKLFESSEQLQQILAALGEASNPELSFLAVALAIIIALIGGFYLQTLLRLKADEESGQLDLLLGRSTSRLELLGYFSLAATLATALLLILSGAIVGIVNAQVTGLWDELILDIIIQSLLFAPVLLLFAGIAIYSYGAFPSKAAAVTWGSFMLAVITGVLGGLLGFPEWVIDLSPFTQVPNYLLGEDMPLAIPLYTLFALILIALGFWRFRRRNLL